jgi:hypothetical protein
MFASILVVVVTRTTVRDLGAGVPFPMRVVVAVVIRRVAFALWAVRGAPTTRREELVFIGHDRSPFGWRRRAYSIMTIAGASTYFNSRGRVPLAQAGLAVGLRKLPPGSPSGGSFGI